MISGFLSADVNRPQWVDTETFLSGDIVYKVDVSSMYHGLEVRQPLLDSKVFGVCGSNTPGQRYKRNKNTGEYIGMLPLKSLISKKLGKEFAIRPKQGFEIPLKKWFSSGRGEQQMQERLLGREAHVAEWFEPGMIKTTIEENNFYNVRTLLALE